MFLLAMLHSASRIKTYKLSWEMEEGELLIKVCQKGRDKGQCWTSCWGAKEKVKPSEAAGNGHQIQNLLLTATQKALERTSGL